MTEDTNSWQSAASAAEECQDLNRIYYKEDLKVIFLTEWGKKMDGNLCRRNGKCHFKVPVFFGNIPKNWKFKMAFAIRRWTPPPPQWHKFPSIFFTPLSQKHHFSVLFIIHSVQILTFFSCAGR